MTVAPGGTVDPYQRAGQRPRIWPARCLGWLVGAVLIAAVSDTARAGEAEVVAASALREPDREWTFRVTVRHADEGWDHYADKWDVVGPDGIVLATRVLLHPHVEEQPFTRSLRNVAIPEEVTEVRIRVHDNVHGYGRAEAVIRLSR